jgi:zinc transport system substrate-binding protein
MAAGVTDISILAPSELRHPAEYELKPSDIMVLAGADLIVSTGFEAMAKKLADAAGTHHIRVLQIDADYSLSTMKKSILAIAAITGTTTKAQENVNALESFMESWKEELHRSGLFGASVLVHVFQKPLMDELGFSVQGLFGPGPLEASQIVKLSATKATLIVDNWHNEAAAPLRETLPQVRYASLINFPGPDGTVTLLDVLADNRKRFSSAVD